MEINQVIEKIMEDKELRKNILTKGSGVQSFIEDAQDYILAIKERRMLCVIHSVSSSGMSRTLSFYSCESNKYKSADGEGYHYRNYRSLFKSLGYSEAKNGGFTIRGCGMDMVFHTNYSICSTLRHVGLLTAEEFGKLSQSTPTVL